LLYFVLFHLFYRNGTKRIYLHISLQTNHDIHSRAQQLLDLHDRVVDLLNCWYGRVEDIAELMSLICARLHDGKSRRLGYAEVRIHHFQHNP